MRLDFNVLWVEDHRDNVESQRERIELLMGKEGFRLRPLFAASIEEAINYIHDDIYGDHIDLVLMDYDLGPGGKGDDGLTEVRANFPYKDIVFYSSQANDLPKLVANKQLQGIYCSSRIDLPNSVYGVFDSLIKKVLDIDHSRGIVMGASSDIDYRVYECLVHSFDLGDDQHKQLAIDSIQKDMVKKFERLKKVSDKIIEIQHVSELNKKEFSGIYSATDKLFLLQRLLSTDESNKESIAKIENYKQNTIPKRNKLAHTQVVNGDGFSRRLIDDKGTELQIGDMKALRQELLAIQDHFDQLLQNLISNQGSDLV
ncbi:response regulator [Methylomonas koyamae]|uniref:Response regulatory domain-containing protein n=1 Tax=Methylomonas koyamae TaxID=702114 RepID=A0AA91I5J7_9GAMM|nr:response regulator [Methylomonas koyamae]OAI24958.1 hypothetical protein A1356_14350 [Methylomonas koyamae]